MGEKLTVQNNALAGGPLGAMAQMQRRQQMQALSGCNAVTARFGLQLSDESCAALAARRTAALADSGRVEFGEGILKPLALAFCDSPYIQQEDWEETLAALQDCFYEFKNQFRDQISDEELIDAMRACFDGAEGSIDYLCGVSPQELCGGPGLSDELD